MDCSSYMQVQTTDGIWQAQIYWRLTSDGRVLIKDGDEYKEIETLKKFTSFESDLDFSSSEKESEE